MVPLCSRCTNQTINLAHSQTQSTTRSTLMATHARPAMTNHCALIAARHRSVTNRIPSVTSKSLGHQTLPVVVCRGREPHKVTHLAEKTRPRSTMVLAMAVRNAQRAGQRMTHLDRILPRRCYVAEIKTRQSTLTVGICSAAPGTIRIVGPIATLASGRILLVTRTVLALPMGSVAAQPIKSRRSRGGSAASKMTKTCAGHTAETVSTLGLPMRMRRTLGSLRALADAKTGGGEVKT